MTTAHRIHLFGASGSGTTTLGRILAGALGVPHLDSDDYYWKPTDPPYTVKNEPAERVRGIERTLAGETGTLAGETGTLAASGWVLSGSLCSWGDPLLRHFTLAVFLYLDPAERLARLRARERRRYGERIRPGGDMRRQSEAFLAWAERYDTAAPPIRSLALHEQWIEGLPCPVLRLDSGAPADVLAGSVLTRLGEAS